MVYIHLILNRYSSLTITASIPQNLVNVQIVKNNVGLHESPLLNKALCGDDSETDIHKCVSWNNFYNAKEVYVRSITLDNLHKGNSKFPNVEIIRNEMIDKDDQ